jgi:hypothetical protein
MMVRLRSNFQILSVMVLLVLSCPLPVLSQSRTAKADPEFNTFWIKFKAAVARSDKAAVAEMTRVPFMLDNKNLDRAGFIKQYTSLFTPKMRRCFARARPSKDQDSMEIFCGQQIFLFAKVDGVYKFTEIGVND